MYKKRMKMEKEKGKKRKTRRSEELIGIGRKYSVSETFRS
jgi:hypothetical protein